MDKINELTLPMSVIGRLIKESLPPNAIAKNEAKLCLSKAGSVFVLFLTSAATEITSSKNQKTMSADHVMTALKEIEFGHLTDDLEAALQRFRKAVKDKKDRKSGNDTTNEKATEEEGEEDEIETID